MPQSQNNCTARTNGHGLSNGFYDMEHGQTFLFKSESVGEGHPDNCPDLSLRVPPVDVARRRMLLQKIIDEALSLVSQLCVGLNGHKKKLIKILQEQNTRLAEQESLINSLKAEVKMLNSSLQELKRKAQKTSKMADTEVKKSRGRPKKADKAEKEVKEKEMPNNRYLLRHQKAAAVEAHPSKEKKVEEKSEKNGDVLAKRGRGRPPKRH